MNNKLCCDIVRDLLPLYVDDVVSETTKNAVKEHLSSCPSCLSEYGAMVKSQLPTAQRDDSTAGKFSKMMKKIKTKRMISLILAVILTSSIIFGGYYVLTEVPFVRMDKNDFKVARIYRENTDNGLQFMLICSMPIYHQRTSVRFKGSLNEENGMRVLEITPLKTFYETELEEGAAHDVILSYDAFTIDHKTDEKLEYDAVSFSGDIIWSKSENGGEGVPDYVSEFFKISDNGYTIDIDQDLIVLYPENSGAEMWDLDGNALSSFPQ